MNPSRVPPPPRLERTPAPRAWRWLHRPPGFESHVPHALLSGDDSRFVRHGDPATLVDFFFPDAPPRMPVAFQQIVCFEGSPGARGIIWKSARWQGPPNIQYGLNHIPTGFDHVRLLE